MTARAGPMTDEQLDERIRTYLSYRAELVASRALSVESASSVIARRMRVGGVASTRAPFSLARVAVSLLLLILALIAAVYVGSLFRERYAPDRPLIEVPIDGTPSAITAAYGSIWVASYPDPYVYQLNPHDGTIRNRIATAGPPCGAMERGYGMLWFTYCTHELARVDPRTLHADRVIGYGSDSVGIGADSVWASDGEFVVRLDPETLAAQSEISVGGDALVTFGEGSAWAVVSDSATVYRIDPATNVVVDTIALVRSGGEVFPVHAATGAGALWVVDEGALQVLRVDAATGSVTTLPVQLTHTEGDGMDFGDWHIAFGRGEVFVRASTDRIIVIDTSTYEVTETITTPDAGGGSFFVADDSLWSGNFGTGTVTGMQLR